MEQNNPPKDMTKLPWKLQMNLFYRGLALGTIVMFDYLILEELWLHGFTSPVLLIPISISLLIQFGFIRSIRCTEEGITFSRGFISFGMVGWQEVQEARIGQEVTYSKGQPSYYMVFTLKTEDGHQKRLTSVFLPRKDFRVLAALVKKMAPQAKCHFDLIFEGEVKPGDVRPW